MRNKAYIFDIMPKMPTVSTIHFIFLLFRIFPAIITGNGSQKNYCSVTKIVQEPACFALCNLLYRHSPNAVPMAVYFQRKKISVELKKRREQPMPFRGHWRFPSIVTFSLLLLSFLLLYSSFPQQYSFSLLSFQ